MTRFPEIYLTRRLNNAAIGCKPPKLTRMVAERLPHSDTPWPVMRKSHKNRLVCGNCVAGGRSNCSHADSSSLTGSEHARSAVARSFGAAGPVNRRHLGALLRPAIGANSLRLGTKINTATFLTGFFLLWLVDCGHCSAGTLLQLGGGTNEPADPTVVGRSQSV